MSAPAASGKPARPPLFGTNGVRGVANVDLTPELALRLGKAMGTYFEGGRVLLGGDPRLTTPMLKAAVAAGLASAGCDVRDGGVGPTPAFQFELHHGGYAGGCIVTASHNPPEFNGIKAVGADGSELPRDEEERIEAHYHDQSFRRATWDEVKPLSQEPGINERYMEAILARIDREAIARRDFTVVVDCSNGAACFTAPFLLRRLGCKVVSINAQPDGAFPGHESEPTPEHAVQLIAAVKAFGADLGCIQDGDADRAVFVDERGVYVPGDKSLAIAAAEIVSRKRGGIVVTPVSSSQAVEDMVKAAGGKVTYTRVGSPTVAAEMRRSGAVFGGEENGGLLFPEHQLVRDGLLAIAFFLELLAKRGKPMSELVAKVPRYANVKTKVPCPDAIKTQVLERFRATQTGKVDATDGVKIVNEHGWVLVRPSGTEPLFRVFAEAKEEAEAQKLAEAKKADIERLVRELGKP